MTLRHVVLTAAAIAVAQPALAGGLAPAAPAPVIVVPEAPTASSGSNLVIPLIVLALLALALSGGGGDDDETPTNPSIMGSLGDDILDFGDGVARA